MIWRLAVVDNVATLAEIERDWSLCDVINAIDVLDAVRAAERVMADRERNRSKK